MAVYNLTLYKTAHKQSGDSLNCERDEKKKKKIPKPEQTKRIKTIESFIFFLFHLFRSHVPVLMHCYAMPFENFLQKIDEMRKSCSHLIHSVAKFYK